MLQHNVTFDINIWNVTVTFEMLVYLPLKMLHYIVFNLLILPDE